MSMANIHATIGGAYIIIIAAAIGRAHMPTRGYWSCTHIAYTPILVVHTCPRCYWSCTAVHAPTTRSAAI